MARVYQVMVDAAFVIGPGEGNAGAEADVGGGAEEARGGGEAAAGRDCSQAAAGGEGGEDEVQELLTGQEPLGAAPI